MKSKAEQEEALEGISDNDQLYLYEMFGKREGRGKGEKRRHALLCVLCVLCAVCVVYCVLCVLCMLCAVCCVLCAMFYC